jgi:hypothetical protein
LERKIETDNARLATGRFGGAQSQIAGSRAKIDYHGPLDRQSLADYFIAPSGIEAKADYAIEQIVATGDSVEHSPHGLIAQMIWRRHSQEFVVEPSALRRKSTSA